MEKTPGRINLTSQELNELLAEIEKSNLAPKTKPLLRDALRALIWLQNVLEQKRLTIRKLLRVFFGKKTETQGNLLGKSPDPKGTASSDAPAGAAPPTGGAADPSQKPDAQKKSGHGKRGAEDYPNAERIPCPHPSLKVGDVCPECEKTKLFACDPGSVLHITAQAPITARVYEPEKLRCPSCGAYFVAKLPEGVSPDQRFSPQATAMVSLYKYGSGFPFYRNEKLQASLGVPLPCSTQWDMVATNAAAGLPAYRQLIRLGAQGECLHHDDTKVKILSLMKENESLPKGERRGVQTTGIVCKCGEREIALFVSGRRHAGENLGQLLALRSKDLPPPMQVADALAANFAHDYRTILVKCMDHARREFIDAEEEVSPETAHVIRELGKVYHHDAVAKARGLDPEARLRFHRENSGPVMGCLKSWAESLLALKRVEPNSPMGGAITYLLNHWKGLTQFMHTPGAPLSNAAVERLLKTAILHRKNSLFYKTLSGAWVGDVLMSLIQTAIRAKANPLDYLTQLQRFKRAVCQSPQDWLPWNYQAAVAARA